MCIGTENSHFQCGHMQSLEISQRCPIAFVTRRDCTKEQCSFIGFRLVNPPLCSDCYQLREEEIRDVLCKKRNAILPVLMNDKRALETASLTPVGRFILEKRIEKGENLMSEILEEYHSAVNEFRETQRLWAGGK